MTAIERYFQTVLDYRKKLDEVNAAFASRFADVELLRGSSAYDWKKSGLDAEFSAALAEARAPFVAAFDAICTELENAVAGKTGVAPTAEQLAILQAFQMRDIISREELVQAVPLMQGCRAAGEALQRLAHKQGHYIGIDYGMGVDQALEVVNNLRRGAERLTTRLTSTGAVSGGSWDLFLISREPENALDCVRRFGSCSEPEQFAALVNG